jgi:hypothetical protein
VSAYWPVLQQRLFALIPTLVDSDWVVFDGPAAGREQGKAKYILVGSSTDGESGSYEQPDDPVDTMRGETGTVLVEVNSWTGDTTVNATRRAECFAVADALETAIRTDQTLGVLPVSSTTELGADLSVPSNGKSARLVLRVSYFTRSS